MMGLGGRDLVMKATQYWSPGQIKYLLHTIFNCVYILIVQSAYLNVYSHNVLSSFGKGGVAARNLGRQLSKGCCRHRVGFGSAAALLI